jgi:hypothetical protein
MIEGDLSLQKGTVGRGLDVSAIGLGCTTMTGGYSSCSILRCLFWLRRLRQLMTRGAVRDRVVKACACLV